MFSSSRKQSCRAHRLRLAFFPRVAKSTYEFASKLHLTPVINSMLLLCLTLANLLGFERLVRFNQCSSNTPAMPYLQLQGVRRHTVETQSNTANSSFKSISLIFPPTTALALLPPGSPKSQAAAWHKWYLVAHIQGKQREKLGYKNELRVQGIGASLSLVQILP